MSNKTKKEFLESIPDSNIEWAAQQILSIFGEKQMIELQACFSLLDITLYKSWGKEMTFAELQDALKMAQQNSKP